MAVHGESPNAKGKTVESGDWSVKSTTGKPAQDAKHKPLTGLSYLAASSAARSHLQRTGEWVGVVRG